MAVSTSSTQSVRVVVYDIQYLYLTLCSCYCWPPQSCFGHLLLGAYLGAAGWFVQSYWQLKLAKNFTLVLIWPRLRPVPATPRLISPATTTSIVCHLSFSKKLPETDPRPKTSQQDFPYPWGMTKKPLTATREALGST